MRTFQLTTNRAKREHLSDFARLISPKQDLKMLKRASCGSSRYHARRN